jgi:hypothetical protein
MYRTPRAMPGVKERVKLEAGTGEAELGKRSTSFFSIPRFKCCQPQRTSSPVAFASLT